MALGVGIVGLPNVGKSTLFNAITKAGAVAANYPFATIDKNVGIVTLPDERLDALAKVYTKGDRVPPLVPTIVEFVDIAGLVKGAHKGEGLGNQFLANIREVAAVAHVVRCFESDEIIHVEGHVDPVGDAVTINLELALADLQILEKRLDRLKKNAKSSKDDALLVPLVESLVTHLSEGKPARTFVWNDPELLAKFYKESGLLTAKPMVYVANVPDSDLPDGGSNPHYAALKKMAQDEGMDVVAISAQIEAELGELDPDEALVFLNDLGLSEPGMNSLVRVAFRLLGLQTFLTAGEKEVRAWTIRQGDKAPTAAGVIHTDLERTFIRALVIDWTKLVEAGSIAASRDRGWLRTEGKDYVMQDGDVVEFLCSG